MRIGHPLVSLAAGFCGLMVAYLLHIVSTDGGKRGSDRERTKGEQGNDKVKLKENGVTFKKEDLKLGP
jgi:hypothetical protein